MNSEQLLFNWQLGRDLAERKAEEKWGKGVVEQVSLDLQAEFLDVKGFSVRNLWNMKKWYSFYAYQAEKVLAVANQMFEVTSSEKLHQLGAEIMEETKLHQPGAEMQFPMIFGFVPWRHHVEIITKCKSVEEALFYINLNPYVAQFLIEKDQITIKNDNRAHGIGVLNLRTFEPFAKSPAISKVFREIGFADELGKKYLDVREHKKMADGFSMWADMKKAPRIREAFSVVARIGIEPVILP